MSTALMTECHGCDVHVTSKSAPPVTFTASSSEQWAETHAAILRVQEEKQYVPNTGKQETKIY